MPADDNGDDDSVGGDRNEAAAFEAATSEPTLTEGTMAAAEGLAGDAWGRLVLSCTCPAVALTMEMLPSACMHGQASLR